MVGADLEERTEERSGYRNGSRPRLLSTQVGDIPLLIPKLRAGSFFPTILEPRRWNDQALYAVIMEAWVKGVSTRKVDPLVATIGSEAGISRSEVSRICQGLDAQMQAFLERPLASSRHPLPLPRRNLSPRPAGQDATGLLPRRRRRHGRQCRWPPRTAGAQGG